MLKLCAVYIGTFTAALSFHLNLNILLSSKSKQIINGHISLITGMVRRNRVTSIGL